MTTFKKIIAITAVLSISQAVYSMSGPWKYFTKAYWLPYTCGDAFNEKPQVFVDNSKDTFIRELSIDDLKLLFNSKADVEKEIERIKPKSIFDSGCWLPVTNGRQFDIEKLEQVKQKFKDN